MTFKYLNIVNVTLMQTCDKPKEKGSIIQKSNCTNKARAINKNNACAAIHIAKCNALIIKQVITNNESPKE